MLHARAAGTQWPPTRIATRKVDALRTRATLASIALSSEGLVLGGRDHPAYRVRQLNAVTRATGNQWPQTCIATRKVDALLSRVACTRRPKAYNAALLATGRVDVLQGRAAGARWPRTCIALAGAVPAGRPRSALAAFRGGLITTTNGVVLAVLRHNLQATKRALQAAKR